MKYLVLMLPVLFLAVVAEAGRMKDVQMEHLESVAYELFGHYDTDSLETRGTKFVPAETGYFVAVSTEVQVYDSATDAFEWVWCTSQFRQLATDRVEVAVTRCD